MQPSTERNHPLSEMIAFTAVHTGPLGFYSSSELSGEGHGVGGALTSQLTDQLTIHLQFTDQLTISYAHQA